MAAKAELKGKVSLNPRDLGRGLRRSMKMLRNFGSGALRVGKAVGVGFAAAFATATAAVAGMAKMTADYGDKLAKTAKRTGLSIEALAELQHAAKLSDTSLAGLDKGIGRMQRVIFEAGQGLTTYVRIFDELDLSHKRVAESSPEEQFRIMTEALAGITDKTKQAALAQQIFGRAGRQLLPMLSGGVKGLRTMREEARRLGLVITPEQATSAENFNDALTRIGGAFKGLVIQSMGLDKITGQLERVVDWLVDLRETGSFKRLADEVLESITQLLGFETGADSAGKGIDKITAALKKMNKEGKFKEFAKDLGTMAKAAATLVKALLKIHTAFDIGSDLILNKLGMRTKSTDRAGISGPSAADLGLRRAGGFVNPAYEMSRQRQITGGGIGQRGEATSLNKIAANTAKSSQQGTKQSEFLKDIYFALKHEAGGYLWTP